jgi:DNA-binding PadR family transcriptional regulator
MTSPVNWALLGLLIRQADYGYRLAQRIERAYGDALVLGSESHVYTALDGLARRGLIEEVGDIEPGTKRQPKVRYRSSAAGLEAYAEWLRELGRRSSPLFSRALSMLECSPSLALEVLDGYERECLRKVGDGKPQASGEGVAADRIVAEDRRVSMDARLPWIEFARNEFERLASEAAR